MRRFFRFSIRDLLWLTLVVALGLGWFVRERQLRAEREAQATRAKTWWYRAGGLEWALYQNGLKVDWESTPGEIIVWTKGPPSLSYHIRQELFEPTGRRRVTDADGN